MLPQARGLLLPIAARRLLQVLYRCQAIVTVIDLDQPFQLISTRKSEMTLLFSSVVRTVGVSGAILTGYDHDVAVV